MKPNDSSSDQKIILKCKPFTVLSAVPSVPSPEATTSRRSNRIAHRANGNEMEGYERISNGKTRQINRKGVQYLTDDDDDEDGVVTGKKKTTNKRRSLNRILSSDEEDDDFVPSTRMSKSPKAKKIRNHNNVQADGGDVIETTRKTPVKRRKPLLTIKCNKITDYFGKSATTSISAVAEEIPGASEAVTTPDVILLSSSEENDDEEIVQHQNPVPAPSHPLKPNKLKYPDYKLVDGTSFAVDAFRFGEIAGVTAYFLTHFHSDHYDGLNKNFNQPIYMSTITGRLVKAKLKVNGKLIKPMNINTKYVIDGVEVTPIDANHCPGAVMLIFKLQCGRTILHTGDFRATPEMESNPVFWNNNFSTVYLDTTYLHKSYNFGTQTDALLFVEDEINKFQQKNAGKKFVVVVGSYMVGKERVWSHIAQTFNMKVWLEPERRKAFDLIYTEENDGQAIKNCVCDVREEAQLHVIPIQCINYAFLMDYLQNFKDYNLLAFRPTGWAQNSKPQYGSRVSIVGVQYSEHSSYSELERFVRFVQPEKVISTVPISSGNPNTRIVPNNWLAAPKPMRTGQRTVTSFMKVRKNSCVVSADKLSEKTITQSETSQRQQQEPGCDEGGSYDSMETDFMP